jgi:hypothetical protein
MNDTDKLDELRHRVHDYRRGRLSIEQERAFEELLMRNPDLVEDVELDEGLERGLRAADLIRPVAHSRWKLPMAFAASLVVGVGIGLGASRLKQSDETGRVAQSVTFDVLRAADDRNYRSLTLRPQSRVLVLDIALPGVDVASLHTVVLESAGMRLTLPPAPLVDGFISLAVDVGTLQASEYRVLVDGSDEMKLTLRLVRPARD